MEKRYSKTYLQELNYKWKNGTLSSEEEAYLEAWENSLEDDLLQLPEVYEGKPLIIRDRIINNVLAKINEGKKVNRMTKLWPRIAAAASLIFIGSLTFYFIQNNSFKHGNDLAPGKNRATLTLADGRKIILTDALKGKVAEQTGVSISKTADGQLVYQAQSNPNLVKGKSNVNILSTVKGEQFQVILPDGTKVWLNAVTSLKFPTNFTNVGKRRVELNGEAYFEVAKDKKHPFIVKSTKQEVEVLGTHFNINSYDDELEVNTTLIEGAVKVVAGNGVKVLKPGQEATLTNNRLLVRNVDATAALAWKNGLFIFEDEPLHYVMRQIERWYNVEVVYENVDKNELYGGSVSRYDHISKVLEKLELAGNIHFKVEGRRVIVSK